MRHLRRNDGVFVMLAYIYVKIVNELSVAADSNIVVTRRVTVLCVLLCLHTCGSRQVTRAHKAYGGA
jgi:hypothetical protein